MLNHTKVIREIYEDIQKKIFYMIPEKWDRLYLYSSIIEIPKSAEKGELFFYYVPKGVLKKKPINVYEIPNKFNLDENEYLQLVELLYSKIKELREEFIKTGQGAWSNITIIIQNTKLRVEYDYGNLENSRFTSYERHIIWRYKYLGIGLEQFNKQDREILKRYALSTKILHRREIYEFNIYLKDVKKIIDYHTEEYNTEKYETKEYNIQENDEENRKVKNQILLSIEKMEKNENN